MGPSTMTHTWFDPTEGPGLEWWWAVEHRGHPAFYLRALLPGDFAPGRLPLTRHARALDIAEAAPPACSTCGEMPSADDLEVVERTTGGRSFLGVFRSGRANWPAPTDPNGCWECGSRTVIGSRDGKNFCAQCTDIVSRRGV